MPDQERHPAGLLEIQRRADSAMAKKVADLLVDTLAELRECTEFQATRSTASRTRFADESKFKIHMGFKCRSLDICRNVDAFSSDRDLSSLNFSLYSHDLGSNQFWQVSCLCFEKDKVALTHHHHHSSTK
jgi:hypothetical protein